MTYKEFRITQLITSFQIAVLMHKSEKGQKEFYKE